MRIAVFVLLGVAAAIACLQDLFAVSVAARATFGTTAALASHLVANPIRHAIGQERAEEKEGALPKLVDITDSTGIDFNHLSSPGQKYIVESMSGGVALIDYDRDGWPDIYFTNAQSVAMALVGKKARSALYHNNHNGTFSDVTDKAGVGDPCWAMGAVVGDYNNDGWPDLLVTCFGGVVLYRNNRDGTFTDVTKQAGLAGDNGWATGASFGDYDRDGWDDLFISHYVDYHLDNLPQFGSSPTCQYRGINVQCGPRGLQGSLGNLYHNNGDGTFTDVSDQAGIRNSPKAFGLTAVWSHFEPDGPLDLFVANDAGVNYLFQNDGHGHFSDVGFSSGVAVSQDGANQANMGIALGDYVHTGRPSIAISHFSEEYMTLYRNDGKMNFTDASFTSRVAPATTRYVGWGDAFLDFDNDGWVDLFLANGHVYPQVDQIVDGPKYREPALLFLNQRDGTFKNISQMVGPAIQIPHVSRGVAVGDLFNDGHPDIVIENLQGAPTLLRVESGRADHWISFQLVGTKSNRLALNARVKVTAGNLVQTREVRSGGSYLSQDDLRLHFGLGDKQRVDKVEIFWPAGGTETLTNLGANHFYCVEEDRGIVARQDANTGFTKRAK
ncbi:MAG: CRTAC1 family protein [Candidatus Acidiferrales bacterium]